MKKGPEIPTGPLALFFLGIFLGFNMLCVQTDLLDLEGGALIHQHAFTGFYWVKTQKTAMFMLLYLVTILVAGLSSNVMLTFALLRGAPNYSTAEFRWHSLSVLFYVVNLILNVVFILPIEKEVGALHAIDKATFEAPLTRELIQGAAAKLYQLHSLACVILLCNAGTMVFALFHQKQRQNSVEKKSSIVVATSKNKSKKE